MIHVNTFLLCLFIASIHALSTNAARNSVPKQTFLKKVVPNKPKFLRRVSRFKQKPNTITMDTTTTTKKSNNDSPKVIICGGGPAGLLTSILLHNIIGVESIVLEKASEPDKWSSKSYSIVCNERGQSALSRGNCLTSAMKMCSSKRQYVYVMDGASGEMKTIPKSQSSAPDIGISRPLLVECLETIASNSCQGVTFRRGAGVTSVKSTQNNDCDSADNGIGHLQVHLDDGTILSATHVIGADGKWSKVRESFSSLRSQATMVTCPSFGVSMYVPPSAVPPEWKDDGTYVVRPPEECMFYIIVSHLPAAAGGGMSISMVCYDETIEKYPWLEPPVDLKPGEYGTGWKNDHNDAVSTRLNPLLDAEDDDINLLSNHLDELFQEVIPAFHTLFSKKVYNSARINRRVTWLKTEGSAECKEVSYSTEDGLVTLIGDAAHAMTASMGEGGNCAMESAVKLVDSVILAMKVKGESICTVDTLSQAFIEYGLSRPKEVQPIQEMSAARNTKRG